MQKILTILLIVCAAMNVTAQQLYTDTFRLGEQKQTVDMDTYLLDLVRRQSEMLHANDTVDTLTFAEIMQRDSIARAQSEMDSLRALNAQLAIKRPDSIPLIAIEKSWIKDVEEDRNDVLRAIRDAKTHWRREATLMAQITQNYVTPNWYQGGSSSFAGLGIAKGQISYISDRFTWENFGEWRIGGSTISADSLHKVNTTDDLLRLYTKANYRIVPTLFASISGEIETRLFPTYKSNSNALKSVSVSPLSYKVIHIMDTARVEVKDYGLDPGQKTLHTIGSSVRVEYVWKPVREVSLETRFYFYTNYHHVEIDLEANCDFIINRFLSARLMLHPRYDSSVIMEGDRRAKIQFRELLSLGFAHKFH